MPALKDTEVKRGGVTARRWSGTINSVEIDAASEIHLSFVMNSKGGGEFDVQVRIGPADFPTLVEVMSLVDRQAAMQAMSQELSRQVSVQPERNRKIRKRTAQLILEAAQKKYVKKPYGQDEQELTVRDGIEQILQEMKLT